MYALLKRGTLVYLLTQSYTLSPSIELTHHIIKEFLSYLMELNYFNVHTILKYEAY